MSKLIGALCVLGACLFPALERTKGERYHIRLLGALAVSLERIRGLLEESAPSMEALLAEGADSEEEAIRRFYRSFRLDELEWKSFGEQWAELSGMLPLSAEEWRSLAEVGQVLGRYGVEEVCQRLERAAAEFRSQRERRRQALDRNQRLWLTLSATAGLLCVLLLC